MLPPILNGTLREHYLLLFGAAGTISMVTGSVAAWLGAQFGARRAAREAAALAVEAADAQMRHRLQLLQQSIESVAVEVERISESQRFAAKIAAERPRLDPSPRATPRSEFRVPTPH